MPTPKIISGKELINILKKKDFVIIRTTGSHYRLAHNDGRITTVPFHGNADLPRGLLRKIIIEDLEIEIKTFNQRVDEN